MPHIIVNYSAAHTPVVPALQKELHAVLGQQETVHANQIKSWAVPIAGHIVGDETKPDEMIHIQLRLKQGRDDALKNTMAKVLHDAARAVVEIPTALSVEVIELVNATYHSSYE